jgi:thioester reductase-like protein
MAGVIKFFEGQNIFVTGATGFLGKVLLEKLLRSCPDVENIFVLIRPKKGKEPSQRINDITSLPVIRSNFCYKRRFSAENKHIVPWVLLSVILLYIF